jgi:hypothetical protein
MAIIRKQQPAAANANPPVSREDEAIEFLIACLDKDRDCAIRLMSSIIRRGGGKWPAPGSLKIH